MFEAKFDGFRVAADTVCGRLTSRNGYRMKRFEQVLDLLPKGHIFDGELVVLDHAGHPLFNELLFGRRHPTYVGVRADTGTRDSAPQFGLPMKYPVQ